MIIFYDSYCKMCTTSSILWKKIDWRNKLSFESFRLLMDYPEEMEKSLHVKHRGQWFQGYNALIEIAKLLPLIWVLLPFMYIFKWVGLGDYIYKKIAANRKLVPVNQCGDSCMINPEKN
ncbi:thiol-disulfide oxidoreductase DCC family protein [Virgibacillus profundi]|nr:DCC1-like thiol-disulfide oxidoreductase family protein [Virgibacillus profundi]